MNRGFLSIRRIIGGATFAFALVASGAQAQAKADEWRFLAAIYGYFPALKLDTQFPSGASGPTIDVSGKTLIENLKFAFMGTFEAEKGQWGLLLDWVNADIGGSKTGTRDFTLGRQVPGTATANLDLDVETNIVTLMGTYRLVETRAYRTGVVFGARMLDLYQTLNWTINGNIGSIPLAARSGTSTASLTNWDAIIGVRGRMKFGDDLRWSVPYYVDIGTGESKFTWQIIAGASYAFGWGDVFAVWRYLDYEFKSGDPLQTISFNGPAVGVAFRW